MLRKTWSSPQKLKTPKISGMYLKQKYSPHMVEQTMFL